MHLMPSKEWLISDHTKRQTQIRVGIDSGCDHAHASQTLTVSGNEEEVVIDLEITFPHCLAWVTFWTESRNTEIDSLTIKY